MKARIIIGFLLAIFISGCEKGYKDEIFTEQYQNIYGTWNYVYTVTHTGFDTSNYHTIKFIKYGLFQYNNDKKGKIRIIAQNENFLELDFDSLFPGVKYAYVGIYQSGDSLTIVPTDGYTSLYIRAK